MKAEILSMRKIMKKYGSVETDSVVLTIKISYVGEDISNITLEDMLDVSVSKD